MEIDYEYPQLNSSQPIPQNSPLILLIGIEKGETLLWTHPTVSLARDSMTQKGKSGVANNCIILSGSLGISKSCLALSAANFMRSIGETVLYNALELLGDAEADAEAADSPFKTSKALCGLLIDLFASQNPAQPGLRTADNEPFTINSFMAKLDELFAVVIINEQGRAYTKLHRQLPGDQFTFRMFYTNAWITRGQHVRTILTGSNKRFSRLLSTGNTLRASAM
jgi:hypothetical protein